MASKIKSHDGSPNSGLSFGGRYTEDLLASGTTAEDINVMPVNRRSDARKAHKRAARDAFSNKDLRGSSAHTQTAKALKE